MRHGFQRFACVSGTLALMLFTACDPGDEEQSVDESRSYGLYDKNAGWTAYHTFDVVQPAHIIGNEHPPKGYIESNRMTMVKSIIAEMEDRGYVHDKVHPDLMISPFVRLDDIDFAGPRPWHDYYYGWYWGYHYPWDSGHIITLEAGTLIIDAVDLGERDGVEDDQLVFRGYATAILPPRPVDASDVIERAVTEIFEFWPSGGFPVRAQ